MDSFKKYIFNQNQESEQSQEQGCLPQAHLTEGVPKQTGIDGTV